MDHSVHSLIGEAGSRVDGRLSAHTQTGKVTAIREDYEDKTKARISVEYLNASSGKSDVPTVTDTITISKKQSKQLALGDHVKVTTTVEKAAG